MSEMDKKMWRSLDEKKGEDPPAARFNPFNNDFLSRREFMEWTGGMVAVLGAASCTRMPQQKILPYTKQPENLIPGSPLYYATAMPLGGRAIGLLVESNMGRPTKVDGNPEHPGSLGTTDAFAQASVLSLYDPDRSQALLVDGNLAYWANVGAKLGELVRAQQGRQGDGLRILTETVVSPTLQWQIETFLKKYPAAQWHQYEPVNRDMEREAAKLAFGQDVSPLYDFSKAKVIVSLDSDFLAEPGCPRYAHDFASHRRMVQGNNAMNRLYAAEPTPSITGAKADHRLIAKASEMESLALALAQACGVPVSGSITIPESFVSWVRAASSDLKAQAGGGIVVAGRWQTPMVQALAFAINQRLRNVGETVRFIAPMGSTGSQTESLERLTRDMKAGKVETLILLGGNPVYNAPADLDFSAALEKVRNRVHCGAYVDETGSRCNYHIPETHYLEQWSDARAYDGTVTVIQPLIAPLFNGKSHHEVMAVLLGQAENGYDIVRGYWKTKTTGDFEKFWTRALNEGVVPGTSAASVSVALRPEGQWAKAASPAPKDSIELLFRPDPTIYDGRFSNNGWLQELPKPLTKLTWDNAAYVSPALAARLGIKNGVTIQVTAGDRQVSLPAWIVPGHAPDTVTLSLGYGRQRAGKMGTGTGFNVYPLRVSGQPWHLVNGQVASAGQKYTLACTQDHHSMEGRPIVRHASLEHHREHPHWTHIHEHVPKSLEGKNVGTAGGDLAPVAPSDYHWGMAINLSACTGCNACVVACQAENNVPVVGKVEVSRGREMHWLRIDRYYEGEVDDPQTHFQPVACHHCETAPCEVVCPVGATTHDNEGLNNMVYNRCVGTKYCSNNCPYKVRRFNFFEYSGTITPTVQMVQNPNVTVRKRGVMEKCSYCVQRISTARIAAKREGRKIQDGEVKTACQTACPTQAIFFGDISDSKSLISQIKAEPQNYQLLEELNTRPRTSYLGKIVNPSPLLKSEKPA